MKKLLVTCCLTAALFVSADASAALNAYLTLKGRQGPIQGSVTQKGREGKIMVIAVDHELKTPVDGKKQHGVLTITKEIDKSSPLLYQAAVNREPFTDFELQFWTPQLSQAGIGSERQHYTIRLKNARIVDIKFKMLNNKNPELTRYAEYEEVAFAYENIQWMWNDGGITASDSP